MSASIHKITERSVWSDICDERGDKKALRETWIMETRRRVADVKSGSAILIDGDVRLAQVRAAIRK